ncbi:hypothetical protein TraAM80_07866 [Trypanosoma rangeli]|uniref:Uncharacterized protein n=1 Tax=Trypanosoma rangeli TaxID=5698 RepID=A0A422N3I7_TRYRA|nr:uncharacterized protein TraAM80_07866 [Trypanosoma rangeli]RNF00002.1 hypothetical protein TraAM80_07866 [Trypanosoma rangeli]|eukprot:RNF00002.1 hypothetical protein TraAM80_07866 [Trypanosoma rangeli]
MVFRRLCLSGGVRAVEVRFLSMTSDARETLTKQLSALKNECKGQGLDLADMSDASRAAMRAVQDGLKRANVEDDQFKGKYTTLSASMKAYTARLSNLQDEARSIQAEADALLKLMWGTEAPPKAASFVSSPTSTEEAGTVSAAADVKETETDDDKFVVEPPNLAKASGNGKRPAERVEAERVQGIARKSAEEVIVEEIEVETIEVEVEAKESPADTMKITDITKELYERGVNFSDCLDARTLRQRYKDMLAGKIPSGIPPGMPISSPAAAEVNTNQPRMPQHRPYQQQQQQANTKESGLAHDPYPNAYRKMVDPMKHVWELKNELAAEKGIDPKSVDLWSGKCKLEDHKMLYDYPSVQSHPIEVRQKGDIPR